MQLIFTGFLWQLPNLIAILSVLGWYVMSHYTISSTNPIIAEVRNEGATTIEGAVKWEMEVLRPSKERVRHMLLGRTRDA